MLFECSELPKKTDKELAWLWALATVLKDMDLFNIVPNPEVLERTPSFACKDKKFKLARNSRKVSCFTLINMLSTFGESRSMCIQ
jgi:hypothetical protein